LRASCLTPLLGREESEETSSSESEQNPNVPRDAGALSDARDDRVRVKWYSARSSSNAILADSISVDAGDDDDPVEVEEAISTLDAAVDAASVMSTDSAETNNDDNASGHSDAHTQTDAHTPPQLTGSFEYFFG
jgi:hypothetical protein